MAGLGVLLVLETTAATQQKPQQQRHLPPPHRHRPSPTAAPTPAHTTIVSKATLHTTTAAAKIGDVVDGDGGGSSCRLPMSSSVPASSATSCSFLQRCFLCCTELADGRDIYIYRGDTAFCSEECRYRHILLADQDDDCARVLAADRSRRRRAVDGGFAF